MCLLEADCPRLLASASADRQAECVLGTTVDRPLAPLLNHEQAEQGCPGPAFGRNSDAQPQWAGPLAVWRAVERAQAWPGLPCGKPLAGLRRPLSAACGSASCEPV